MKKQKCFALVLAVGILLQLWTAAVLANENTGSDEKLALLQILGIEDQITDDILFDAEITRADFAVYVGKIIGVDEKNTCNKRYYMDVPEDHWAVNTINTLTEREILSGSDKRFRPDDKISYPEALTMLLNAVGYGKLAMMEGGYPSGYRRVAANYHIQPAVVNESALTKKEVYSLIFETLSAPVPEIAELTENGGYTVQIDKEHDLFSKYFALYEVKGFVTSVFGFSVDAESACGNNEIGIDDKNYLCDVENAMDFLGRRVRGYYREINGERVMISLAADKSDESIELTMQEFESYQPETRMITYTKEGETRSKSKTIAPNAVVIRNGKNVSDNLAGAFLNLNEGTILLSSSDKSGKYDTVVIKNYTDVIISAYDKKQNILYDKISRDNRMEFSDAVYLRIYAQDGSRKTPEDLLQNMTASVCSSERYCEIRLSENTASGKISQVSTEEDKAYLGIEGEDYEVSVSYYEKNKDLLGIGRNIKLYINAFGRGIFAEVYNSDGFLYGYAIKSYLDEDEDAFFLKLVEQSGTIEKLRFAQKPKINDQRCRTIWEIEEAIAKRTGKTADQVVIYKLDTDGNISALETPSSAKKGMANVNLRIDQPLYSGYYYASNRMMGESVIVDDQAVCFKVPEAVTNMTTDEDYSVIKLSALSEKRTYTAEAYKTNDQTLTADILLIRSNDTNGSWYHNMVVADRIYELYNEEKDETEQLLDAWIKGNKVTYRAARKVSFDEMPQFFGADVKNKLSAGDVLRIFVNSEGEITNADRFYSAQQKKPNLTMNNEWNWEIYFACGYITDFENGIVKFSYEQDGKTKTGIARLGNAPILVSSASKNKITVGQTSDIDEAINRHSLVYIGQNFGSTQMIYIIQ